MKNYFIRLFDYDRHANLQILDTILAAHPPEKPVQLMAHLLASQQIWLQRCKKRPTVGGALWPDWKPDTFETIIKENHSAWISFLEGLSAESFSELISYQNSKGDTFTNRLEDILAHLINHGTHHRAQAGQHLKLTGAPLPATDYIFYLRGL